MLGVESLTELHTTTLGWHQYNVLWDILTQTGLIFLPFLVIIVSGFVETVKSQRPGGAGFTSLRRMELELVGMLTILILAGYPLLPLHQQELTFSPVCATHLKSHDESLVKKVAHSTEVAHTRVPVWWYAVMSISEGITSAAKRSLPCASDMHVIFEMMNELRITDPVLRQDIEAFAEECYLPTLYFDRYTRQELPEDAWEKKEYEKVKSGILARYDTRKIIAALGLSQTELTSPHIQTVLENVARGSMEWMGSELYLQTPGTYFYSGRLTSKRLTCSEVWNGYRAATADPTKKVINPYGLYPRLKVLIHSDPRPIKEIFLERVTGDFRVSVGDRLCPLCALEKAQTITDETVYSWILMQWLPTVPIEPNKGEALYPSLNRYSTTSLWGATKKLLLNLGSVMGAVAESLELFPMMTVLQEAAPVVQSLVLMSFYLMLPIGLILSGFSIEFLLMGAAGIFTIKFMSYFFYLAKWLNLYLLELLGAQPDSMLGEWVIPLVLMTMFFALPLLFVTMLLWAGYEVGGAYAGYDKVGGEDSALGESGRAGVRFVGQVVDAALRVATAGASGVAKAILGGVRIVASAFRK